MMRLKNKGYSLVELLIVLSLIAILAGMSLVSLTLINTARAKQASTVFGDEVNAVRKKAMNMSFPKPETGTNQYTVTDGDTYQCEAYGLVLYYEDDVFQIVEVPLYKYDGAGTDFYKFYLAQKEEPIRLSSRADVKFTGYNKSFKNGAESGSNGRVTDYVPDVLDNTGSICIMFDRRGNCTTGYGEYDFYKKNGNRVARVFVKQNGSIEIR